MYTIITIKTNFDNNNTFLVSKKEQYGKNKSLIYFIGHNGIGHYIETFLPHDNFFDILLVCFYFLQIYYDIYSLF